MSPPTTFQTLPSVQKVKSGSSLAKAASASLQLSMVVPDALTLLIPDITLIFVSNCNQGTILELNLSKLVELLL
jgi:hypothetical protein